VLSSLGMLMDSRRRKIRKETPRSRAVYSRAVGDERGEVDSGEPLPRTKARHECARDASAAWNARRSYRAYFQSCGNLRDEAQLRGPAIGRRVVPPEVAGLLSQWGRERPPCVSFGVPAPSRGSLTPCSLCPLRPANPGAKSHADSGPD
jgi:hypothetical protein